MGTWAAFLRGMNLGRRRIRNQELCACFEAMGFENVSAFLASGNVVFDTARRSAARLEELIATGLRDQLQYDVPTFIRSAREVADIAAHQPFDASALAASSGKPQVILLASLPTASERKAVVSKGTRDDRLAVKGREIYWLPQGGVSGSTLEPDRLVPRLGGVTVRTHRTLVRLSAKLGGP